MLREEAGRLGVDPGSIEVREVSTDEAAEREGFVGSPTIRIDGSDIQPTEEPAGLTCRVYRLPDGSVSPLPERDQVRDALAFALKAKVR